MHTISHFKIVVPANSCGLMLDYETYISDP